MTPPRSFGLIDCLIRSHVASHGECMKLGRTANRWWYGALVALMFLAASTAVARPGDDMPGRDPKQAIDTEYTKKILEYTTQPMFASPLVDYLPASKSVPTPKAVLGDIAGAPGILPYSKQVYEYMR